MLQLLPEPTAVLADHRLAVAVAAKGIGIAERTGAPHIGLARQWACESTAGAANVDLHFATAHFCSAVMAEGPL